MDVASSRLLSASSLERIGSALGELRDVLEDNTPLMHASRSGRFGTGSSIDSWKSLFRGGRKATPNSKEGSNGKHKCRRQLSKEREKGSVVATDGSMNGLATNQPATNQQGANEPAMNEPGMNEPTTDEQNSNNPTALSTPPRGHYPEATSPG